MVGYTYDAWGNCIIDSSTTNYDIAHDNPIRYRGYYHDEDTKLYYLNSRYYSPEWRRFISPDDTAYLDPENVNALNLYCYCGNDPVNYADPSGHAPEWLKTTLKILAVAAIGIGIVLSGGGALLGGILIGAGAGALINGYVTEANGGSFIAGYLGGAISGALCGAGAGWAGELFIVATTTSNLAALGWYGASLATSFAGGFAGNMVGTIVTSGIDKQKINPKDLVTSSIIMGGLNMFAGIGSGTASAIAKMTDIVEIGTSSTFAYHLLAATVAGCTEAFYDTASYLYSILN